VYLLYIYKKHKTEKNTSHIQRLVVSNNFISLRFSSQRQTTALWLNHRIS